jgi:Flp pilus assembly protein TadG
MTEIPRWAALGRRPSLGRISRLRICRVLASSASDRGGATAVIIGLASMVLLGFTALGTEASYWYFSHRNLQNAADSAAMSAVAALLNIPSPDAAHKTQATAEARATAARYGFVDTQGGVSVAVNIPPTAGAFTSDSNAVEVVITEPQALFLTAAIKFGGTPLFAANPTQRVRAVANPGTNGNGCVVALDSGNVGDLFNNGNTQLNLTSCDLYVNSSANSNGNYALNTLNNASISAQNIFVVGGVDPNANITTTGSTYSADGLAPINDPYANVAGPTIPGSCPNGVATSYNNTSLNPGLYCGGLTLKGTIMLSPGVYVIEGTAGNSQFTDSGQANVTGNNVLIYLTGDTPAHCTTMNFSGPQSSLTLTPPQDGSAYQGIAIYQDHMCTQNPNSNANQIGGGAAISITGVIYFPEQNLTFNGGTSTGGPQCEEIVALTLTFHGNSQFQSNCTGVSGVAQIGAIPAQLVE